MKQIFTINELNMMKKSKYQQYFVSLFEYKFEILFRILNIKYQQYFVSLFEYKFHMATSRMY